MAGPKLPFFFLKVTGYFNYRSCLVINLRPILTDINGSTVTFKDGSTEEYDVIIKCTGYLHDFPFMRLVSIYFFFADQTAHRATQ